MLTWPTPARRALPGIALAAVTTLGFIMQPAAANPTITAVFDPAANGGAGISVADQNTILAALPSTTRT